MRIGVLLSSLPTSIGGGSIYERSLFTQLQKHTGKHEVVYLTFSHDESSGISKDVTVIQLSSFWGRIKSLKLDYFFHKLGFNYKLNKVCRKNEIDIIWFISSNYIKTDIPYIFTVFDLQHRMQPYFPEVSSLYRWERRENLYQQSLKKASYIIAGNAAGKELIKEFYDIFDERIRVIPLFVPDRYFESIERNDLVAENTYGKYIFYPAQFWPHKNHIRLLKALTKLDVSYSLILTGYDHGNLSNIKHKIEEMGLTDRVQILGFVKSEELVALYRNAYALVYPSLFGPDNIPPLEAMAVGCPVLCARMIGMEAQLQDNALFFDALNEDEIVENLIKLEDREFTNWLTTKAMKFVQKLSSQSFINDFFKIINEFDLIRETWAKNNSEQRFDKKMTAIILSFFFDKK